MRTKLRTLFAASLGTLALAALPALAITSPEPPVVQHDPHGDEDRVTALDATATGVWNGGTVDQATTDGFFDVWTEGIVDLGARTYTADDVPTSGLGLWWRGVTESVSLAFTFDPVARAEKELKYSEERMSMAHALLAKDPTDTDLQGKALRMVERSDELLGKVENGRDKWSDSDAAGDVASKVASHVASREKVLDRMEGQMLTGTENEWDLTGGESEWDIADISSSTWGRFQELRAKSDESGTRLMTALENENIPDDVRTHLGKVKQGIESFAADREALNDVQKELLDMRAAGEEGADDALKALREERQQMLKQRGARLGGGETEWEIAPKSTMEADLEDEFGGNRPPRQGMEADLEDELGGGENEWDFFHDAADLRTRILDRMQQDGAAGFAPRDWLDAQQGAGFGDTGFDPSCLEGTCPTGDRLQQQPAPLRLDPNAPNLGLPPREDVMMNGSCLAGDPNCGTSDGFMIQRNPALEPDGGDSLDAQRFPDYAAPPPGPQ